MDASSVSPLPGLRGLPNHRPEATQGATVRAVLDRFSTLVDAYAQRWSVMSLVDPSGQIRCICSRQVLALSGPNQSPLPRPQSGSERTCCARCESFVEFDPSADI